MICSNCGKQIPDDAQFCNDCNACSAITVENVSSSATADKIEDSGILLASFKHVSKYSGTPVGGYADSVGTLSVFSNRLEFDIKVGDTLINSIGKEGMIWMALDVLNAIGPPETISLENISELRKGKYLVVYKTLVVTEKNGDIWSFCPVVPGSSMPRKIIDLLKPYMQNQTVG